MRGVARTLLTGLKLLIVGMLAALAVILRYLWNTPQPLRNTMPGDPRLYRWTQGHIFFRVIGPAEAPPLVLFHAPEIGASSHEMRHLLEKLGQRYRVYVPDLIGFGLSDRPPLDYRAETYVQLYQDFLADVVAQPATLVGSGLSCNYMLAVAARRPDLCRRVILLSPTTLYTGIKRPAWLSALLLNSYTGLLLYSLFTTRVILRKIVAWPHRSKGAQVSPEELASVFANAHQFGAEHAALALLAGHLDLDVLPQIEKVVQPVLTIWGRHAQNATHAIGAENSRIPAKRVLFIEGGEKSIHEEQPAQVAARIEEWLKELEATALPTGVETANVRSEGAIIANRGSEGSAAIETPEQPQHTVEPVEEREKLENGTKEVTENVSDEEVIEAYCVKCRQKRPMQQAKRIVTKNGRSAMEGTCPVCGTRLFRFISR